MANINMTQGQLDSVITAINNRAKTSIVETKTTAMTKAQFNALAEERKSNRAGSGFDEWGKHFNNVSFPNINEGLWTGSSAQYVNKFQLGTTTTVAGVSKSLYPLVNVNGVVSKIFGVAYENTDRVNPISLPTAPNIYPYDTVLTTEQINSGVIKHADSSNSGLIVNGKFDTDTSGWVQTTGTWTATSNGATITLTGSEGRLDQSITNLVIGKNYIIECGYTQKLGSQDAISVRNATTSIVALTFGDIGRYTLEFTATSTTHTLRVYTNGTGTFSIDNIAVYSADAISRSDLVFLESFHEDIAEKNIVYPLGNVQYLGGNTDGLTGISNGSFTGFETYSLMGNWMTPSALIGKGYVWADLTEAQKKAFISNPDNNCYLDGGKVIQVRYRVRVVQGWGDSWEYPFNNVVDGGGSNPRGSTVAYSINNNIYPKPKGKKVSISFDINSYSGGETGFFANKNYKNVTTAYEVGMATAVDRSTNSLDTTVAYEGKCFALPIALVHR